MTKFPDISLTLVKWPKFPDNSLTWRKFCFSLTFPWHVATLTDMIENLTFPRTTYGTVIIQMHSLMYVISNTVYSFTIRSPANGNGKRVGKTGITVSVNQVQNFHKEFNVYFVVQCILLWCRYLWCSWVLNVKCQGWQYNATLPWRLYYRSHLSEVNALKFPISNFPVHCGWYCWKYMTSTEVDICNDTFNHS